MVFALAFILVTTGGKSKKEDGIALLKSVLKKYQKADAVKINVGKRVHLALLDENKSSEGTLLLSKGQLRLEIQKPDPSTLIVTKNLIWVISPANKDLGSKTQIMKISSSNFKKQAKAPLALLMGRPGALDQFVIKSQKISDSTQNFKLEPKSKDVVGEIVALEIDLDKSGEELKRIAFSDDIENQTSFEFKSSDFKAEINKDTFDFTPSASAEITEYK